jgi:DNA-binding protein
LNVPHPERNIIYSEGCGSERGLGFRRKAMAEENVIYIGKKATMNYVLAVVSQINGGCNDVCIKARGRAISRAVDVAEIVRNRFVKDLGYKDVKIETEVLPGEHGESANVSSIEIYMER